MVRIKIVSPKYGEFESLVDSDDYRKIKHLTISVGVYYQKGTSRIAKIYARYVDKRKNHFLHRLIMNVTDTKLQVDHINGNTLDNRKCNLRICTQKQNLRNQKLNIKNKSGYKGVFWRERLKKWETSIQVDCKHIYLGIYENKVDAAKAYNEAAKNYFGEFAHLNIIPEKEDKAS
jgi:hypothetical protein